MSDLTVDEKMRYDAHQAAEDAAEKHFFDLNQPHYPGGFSVYQRNTGHYDISAARCPGKVSAWKAANPQGQTSGHDITSERAFCIRGEPGDVYVRDERWDPHRPHPRESLKFRSVLGAMVWIMEELMQEPPR